MNYRCKIWVGGMNEPVDLTISADSVKHLQTEIKHSTFLGDYNKAENVLDYYPTNKIYKLQILLPENNTSD